MAKYVDGFVIVVPKKKVAAYQKIAKKASKIWMKYGALEYFETVADDVKIPGLKLTFPKMAKASAGETVVFSWIVYKSRKHRDAVNKKVGKDPFMVNFDPSTMPMNMKKFTMAGFKTLVEA